MAVCRSRRRSTGFTLIEVLITVVIVAILSSLAVPFYTDYVRRGHVQEAVANLAEFRVRMEQNYQDERQYGAAGGPCDVTPPDSSELFFNYICELLNDGQGFRLEARGKPGGVVSGLVYAIDHSGTRGTICDSCAWNFESPVGRWVLKRP